MKINALLATICSGLCINAVPLSAQEQTIAQQEEQTPFSKAVEAFLRIVHINEQLDKLPVPAVCGMNAKEDCRKWEKLYK